MASSYPGSLDSFDSIASDKKTSDLVGGRTHRDMHNDLGDAIEAVQTELGTDPAGSFATVKARLAAWEAYAAKTSAYTATSADSTLNVTSGTFTLDLPAASGVTGKTLQIKNSGTGVVTLDGNSSETVEGVATLPLGLGSYVEITSTGSAWILTGGVPDTGRRLVTADVANSWAASTIYLRRVGNRCTLWGTGLNETSASSDAFYTLTSGFLAAHSSHWFGSAVDYSTYDHVPIFIYSTSSVQAKRSKITSTDVRFTLTWITDQTWPTSLPGSAV